MDLCHKIFYSVTNAPQTFTVWIFTSTHDVVKALMSEKLLYLNHHDNNDSNSDFMSSLETSLAGLRFPVYAAVQRNNEVVIIPPGSVYLSAAFGGRCSQIAWNIHTPFSVERSITRLLPCTRLMKQLEHHKIKAMAYYTLANVLKYLESSNEFSLDTTFANDLWRLVNSVTCIMLEEGVSPADPPYLLPSRPLASRVCCFCGCSIFNRGFECPVCNLDVCVMCVAEGMGCGTTSHFGSLAVRELVPAAEMHDKIVAARKYYCAGNVSRRPLPPSVLPDDQRSPMLIAQLQISRVNIKVNINILNK